MSRQLYYMTAVFMSAGVTFYGNYLYSQWLSVEEYGQFGLHLGLLGILVAFVMLGQATAFTTIYFSEEKKGRSTYPELCKSLTIMFICSFVFVIFGLIIWYNFLQELVNLEMAIALVSAVILVAYRDFFVSVLNCIDSYKLYFLSNITFGAVFLLVVLYGQKMEHYFYGLALGALALSIGSIFFIIKRVNISKLTEPHVFTSGELILFGWVAIPGMIISALNSYVDRYMISELLSMKDVGLYMLAVTLSIGIGSVFITSIMKANIVTMLQSLQSNRVDEYMRVSKNIYLILIILACAATFVYYTFGQEFIIYVFGDKYRESTGYMLPLFLCVMIMGASQVVGQALIQRKKMYILVLISAVILTINAMINYLLIPIIGVSGAIMAFAISAVCGLILICKYSIKEIKYIVYPVKYISFMLFLIIGSLWVNY